MFVFSSRVYLIDSMTERKKLAIIDGKSVFYRGYYAMPNLSTKDGVSTGGVYGFAVMALEVIKRLKPDYVCVAWDKPKTNIRKRLELYPEYKAGRKPAPPDFYAQIPLLHELLQAFGWPLYELDDYEADDIMGTLALQASEQDINTLLITSDLDLLQVISDHTKVYALKTGLSNIELYSRDSFEAKYQIKLDQFLDYKALVGDSSDNIPGVPGIGPVAARKLLEEHKTLDGIYENLALLPSKLSEKLVANKDLAGLSKKLAAIWTNAPIKLDLKEVDGSKCDPDKVLEVLRRLEFRTLVRQLPEIMQVKQIPEEAVTGGEQSFPAGTGIYISKEQNYDKLNSLKFKKNDLVFIDSRTGGKHGRNPLLLTLSSDPKTVYILDLASLPHGEAINALKNSGLSDARLAGRDVKATLEVLMDLGISLPTVGHDVLVGSFLLNSLRREQSLTELAEADLDYNGAGFEDSTEVELIDLEPEIIAVLRALYAKQHAELEAIPKLKKLAHEIEWPVISVLAEMEYRGIQLDTKYLGSFAEELRDQISDIEQLVYGHADQEFNISSSQQLSVILFEKLALPTQGVKKGKSGIYSTAAPELERLRALHPIIELISQYREMTKLMSTYVETLPLMVDEDSRLHTTFALTVAQTGRLSSNDPNLQNIPVRTDLGRRIRTAFVAAPGKVLIGADYSQFELRLAAVLADDKELIEIFNKDIDVHTATAAQVYEREVEDVTKTMRRDAKVINFGVLYGMSPHGLSAATGMTFVAAKAYIDKYFELRAPLLEYMNGLKEKARTDGYVETLFGRRRPMPDIHSGNFVVRAAAERAAMNMPIQGTEADLMKMAMIDVQKYLGKVDGADMLLQIHDSILVEAYEADAEKIARELKDIMEKVHKLPVKLTVDTSFGGNWGEL